MQPFVIRKTNQNMDSKLYPPRMAELEKGYKLVYGKIHKQLKRKWFQYTELFFIVGSIASIIYSSFEISAPFRAQLFLFNLNSATLL